MTLDELTAQLPDMPRTLFATVGAADLLAHFDETFSVSHPAAWQWRVGDQQRRAYSTHPERKFRRATRVTVAVYWFGFKGSNPRYHRLIDPITMYGQRFTKLWPGDEPEIVRLLHWAIALRDFCAENNLEVKPTLGGISAQLLTDPRFYPEPRRKVPAATNATVREQLPGNHYTLHVHPSPHRDYRATYIDQHRAHHYHAQHLRFPHADHLYAYGYFCNLTHYYREQPSPRFMGLYCLDLHAPRWGKAYSWLKRGDLTHQFVYTNELTHLLDMGYTVTGIRAAWGSHHRDAGLNKLAAWACEQLDQYHDARWLKPLLLATYGTLACRPTFAEAVFKQAKRGEEVLMLTGQRSLTGTMVKRPMKLEPGIANVLHRGMIEAATRSESVGFAQHLEHQHQRVLAIYADAVIIEADDDRPLSSLPDPWEVKRELNHYQPINLQAFISDGMTRLPGVSQEIRPYRQRTPGRAPHRVKYEAVSGQPVITDRRI
jgi:hypothetical protein